MKKNVRILIAGMLLLCLSLAGCTQTAKDPTADSKSSTGQSSTQGKEVKLVMWNCDGSPLYNDPFVKFANDYMALHSNVKIEVVGLPYETNVEKFDTAVATNTAPDLAYYEVNHLQHYIEQGALVDLNKYFNKWDKKSQFDLKRLDIPGYVVGDARYYFPIEFAAAMMFYRKDILDKHNVAIPKTWDDFYAAADTLTIPQENLYGYSFYLNQGASRLEAYLLAYTGATNYFDEQGKCFVRDPKALEGLKRFAGMYLVNSADDISNGNSEACSALVSGVAAMSFINAANYPWMIEDAPKDSIVGYAAPKAVNGKTVLSIGINQGGAGFSIFTDSKNPDAAWEFMAYMLEPEQNSYWNQQTGAFPINIEAYNDDWIKQTQPLAVLAEVLMDKDTHIVSSPFYLSEYNDIFNNILHVGFQEVVLGEKDPAVYLEEWADAMEKANAANAVTK